MSRNDVAPSGSDGPVYSIASLVNDPGQHREMQRSFEGGGFTSPDCEYLTANYPVDGYEALNGLLERARGTYVILCHQDVRLLSDGRLRLDQCLADLENRDPSWALAGNAGGVTPGKLAIRITDPHGSDRRVGALPARVSSLDENFIVVRRSARLGFSRDLKGFHLYGADICLVSGILGYSAYVIDFHLQHLSPGRKDASFAVAEASFRAKWAGALQPRWIQTTCTLLYVGGWAKFSALVPLCERAYGSFVRRLPSSRGWTNPA